jgi:hypothetical protein
VPVFTRRLGAEGAYSDSRRRRVTGLRTSRGRGPTVGEQSTGHTLPRTAAAVLVLAAALTTAPVRANEHDLRHDRFVREARAMMAEPRAESRRDTERIAAAYGEGAAAFVFSDLAELTASARDGVIRTLPIDEHRFNVRPRLSGAYPIGEKDLVRQAAYVAARPATLGVLLQVASRVRSTRLEVTSLGNAGVAALARFTIRFAPVIQRADDFTTKCLLAF